MQIYIVRIESPEIREELKKHFEKVGKPRAIHNSIIVETDKPKQELEQFPGVVKVQEDVKIEFAEMNEQEVDNWALPRICGDVTEPSDHDGGYGKYIYNRTGKGVDIYIADTGIGKTHNDFKDKHNNSRVKTIYPNMDNVLEENIEGNDYGTTHGTSVASCAAGIKCGIAKEANIFNVWVLHSGSSTVKGLDRVLYHHLNKNNNNPSILNMSFGAKSDTYLDDETKDLVENGIICVACAHNYNEPKSTAPAIHPHVLSIGSADWSNSMARHSNYGETVDFLAPGEHVKVARVNSLPDDCEDEDNCYIYYGSGTSYASPYTAGILALIVQESIIKNEEDVNRAIEILYEYSKKDFIEVKENTPSRFSYSLVENEPINKRYFQLNIETEGKGSVQPNIEKVEFGDTIEFQVIPDKKHKLKEIKGDNSGGELNEEGTYKTNPVKQDSTYKFVFEEKSSDNGDEEDKNIMKYIVLGLIGLGVLTAILTAVL